MVAGACWGVQLVAVIGMVEFLGIPKELAQVLGMGFYTGLNYLGSRFIVFRKTAQQTATEAPEKTQDTD
jgi:putative flippase GtrA